MLRALWFMLKVGALVALVVWIADRPGTVRLEWMAYTFTVHVGLFLLFTLAIILCSIFIYNTITAFVKLPSSWRRYKSVRNQEKGYEALTIGLTAVAAGDTKVAVTQAKRAEKFLKDDTGLPLLLKAQSARLDGRESDALDNFAALLEDKNAAFLGVRGLLQAALDNEDFDKALELATHAMNLHSRQPWILRVVYDLHIRLRNWDEALSVLYRLEKAKAVEADRARADRVAILIAQSEEAQAGDATKLLQKAVKIDPSFAPAVVRLARLYLNGSQRRKAVSLVKKTWKRQPHEDLVHIWMLLLPARKSDESLARMRWIEELLKVNSDNAPGQFAAGKIALEEKLWGEAREHLIRAAALQPTTGVYERLAALEERSGQSNAAAEGWHEKARAADPDYIWTCGETGRTYSAWSPLAQPHGAFNSMAWVSTPTVIMPAQLDVAVGETPAVLDVPKL